jgi:hypothetical protein
MDIKTVKPDPSSFYRAVYGVLKTQPSAFKTFCKFLNLEPSAKSKKEEPTEDAFVRGLRARVAEDINYDKIKHDLKSNTYRRSLPEWMTYAGRRADFTKYVQQHVRKRTSEVASFEKDVVASLIAQCFGTANKLHVIAASNARNADNHPNAFVVVNTNARGAYGYVVPKHRNANSTNIDESFKPNSKIELDIKLWKLPNRFSFQQFIDDTFRYKITSKSDLFPSQRFVKDFIREDSPYRGLLLYHGLGAGKCHARDTPILMFDGSIKYVQDVRVGDLVMGDDSKPRTVQSLVSGWDYMYDVMQEGADTYTVNSAHVLCLMDPNMRVVEMECDDYVVMPRDKKNVLHGFGTVVEFPMKPLASTPCDPYMLGFWLADAGPSRILGFTRLPFVVKHLHRVLVGSNKAALRTLMLSGKKIPTPYLRNTIAFRQKIMAGLIDADGHVGNGGMFLTVNSYALALDIMFVARSIGLGVCIKKAQGHMRGWCIRMFGPNVSTIKHKFAASGATTDLLPQQTRKINVTYSGFFQYYGFSVDGNHRYVLGDMTVTHNSCASIVAAENMIGNMKVEVLLAASLQRNFIDEIKNRCGNIFFSTNKFWKFLSLKDIQNRVNTARLEDALNFASDITMVDKAVIKKNKGVWIANSNKSEPNFLSLSDGHKDAVSKQLTSIIKNKYNFINYNGLTYEAVKTMAALAENPFDNKVVIVDEVHNFISRVLGSGKTGIPLYNLLMRASNCKLILLSGTPLINHPYELSYIVNLIKGVQVVHNFEFKTKDALKAGEAYMKDCPHVDNFEINLADMKIKAQLVPEGFAFSDKRSFMVSKEPSSTPSNEVVRKIREDLGCKHLGTTESLVMPTDKDEFIKRFVSEENATIKNDFQLARRLMGTVSHYATIGDNFPKLEPTTFVTVEMSEHQFNKYEEVRLAEIRKESFKKRGAGGLFADVPSTYRAYSRMCCNFVFPEGIQRPYKGANKKTLTIGDDDNDPTYLRAMRELETRFEEILGGKGLATLSPKTAAILARIKGKCLIYSEYLVAEGLGHVALALKANGWAELRLKKANGSWVLDIDADDLAKPKFFQFKTDDEEVEVLKSLFNNDLERVPQAVIKGLDGTSNLRGEMLQAILITKSGAEGISLKHVRQVHILEPYWHEVRVNQIIGRAVRANSHADLPSNERRVNVFRYMCKFTAEQIKGSKTLKNIDKKMTTDEHVYSVASRKDNIIKSVQRVMMAAAVDCKFHSNHHPDVECILFPNTDDLAFNMDMNKDDVIVAKKKTKKIEASFRDCMINGVHYAYDGATNTLYDMEAYMGGKLVRMGKLVQDPSRPNVWRMET